MIKNKCLTFVISVFLFAMTCICYYPHNAWGGITVGYGIPSGPPEPLRQIDLMLEKEQVVFKNGAVQASYWIRNPLNKKVITTLGLPFEYKDYLKEGLDFKEYSSNLLDSMKIVANGETILPSVVQNPEKNYPIVIAWTMTFLPNAIAEFTISYPMTWSSSTNSQNTKWEYSFRYLDNSGSHWKGPIQETSIEYCDEGLSFFKQYPSERHTYWYHGGQRKFWQEVKIKPSSFTMDNSGTCVVWKSKNKRRQNKITVTISGGKENYDQKQGYLSRSDILKKWCGLTNEKYGKQFADKANLQETIISKDKFPALVEMSYKYLFEDSTNPGYDDYFENLPEHIKTDNELLLLRYLRNFIYALHGYKFQNQELAECYSNIETQGKEVSSIEKKNIDLIRRLEKETSKKNQQAWTAVAESLKPGRDWMEIIRGSWGSEQNQFGKYEDDTSETIPEGFWPLLNQIVVRDQVNNRMKIYSNNGDLENTVAFKKQLNKENPIYDYLFGGKVVGYYGDSMYTYFEPFSSYIAYSLTTGHHLDSHMVYARPGEIGSMLAKETNAEGVQIEVSFGDTMFSLNAPRMFEYHIRDLDGYLYGIMRAAADYGKHYRVFKYDKCGRLIGSMETPSNVLLTIPSISNQASKVVSIVKYGEPVIGPKGDIYVSKITPDAYSILEWTWPENANTSDNIPDPPLNLIARLGQTFIDLSWKLSPHDSACVTGYEIFRSTNAGSGYSFIGRVEKSRSTYRDIEIGTDKSYYYKVRAIAGSHYSFYSNETSAVK